MQLGGTGPPPGDREQDVTMPIDLRSLLRSACRDLTRLSSEGLRRVLLRLLPVIW